MTPAARVHYHKTLWPAACRAQGWNAKDDAKRRHVVLTVMIAVGGPQVTTSSPEFGAAETTALFAFLHQQANPNDLVAMEEWLKCKDNYVTYNQARQADWHERQAYGKQGSGKLARDRFARARTAAGGPLEDLDPNTVKQRLTTMRARNEARTGYQRRDRQPDLGQNLASTKLASGPEPVNPAKETREQGSQVSAADLAKHNCPW